MPGCHPSRREAAAVRGCPDGARLFEIIPYLAFHKSFLPYSCKLYRIPYENVWHSNLASIGSASVLEKLCDLNLKSDEQAKKLNRTDAGVTPQRLPAFPRQANVAAAATVENKGLWGRGFVTTGCCWGHRPHTLTCWASSLKLTGKAIIARRASEKIEGGPFKSYYYTILSRN